MSNFWMWLRNKIVLDNAYVTVSTQLGDDIGGEPILAPLREFASSPIVPSAVPVLLLEAFNASQKRVSRRRKIRAGSGALFGVAILIPSLAYAGVLPSPVSRIVQRVFNVISLPIQIPSVTDPSPSATTPNSDERTPGSSNEAPDGEQSQSPNENRTSKPSNESSPETSSSSDSEPSTLPSIGVGGNGEQSVTPTVDSDLTVSEGVEVDGLPSISGLSNGLDGSQPATSPGSGETAFVDGN
jgi:hypothetical protein